MQKNFFNIVKTVASKWMVHNDNRFAAAIAFFAIFSFSPLVIITVNIISLILGKDMARQEVTLRLQESISPQVVNIIKAILSSPISQNIFTSTVSLVVLLFASSAIFSELRHAFNKIFEYTMESRKERFIDFFIGKLTAMIWVPIMSFLFLLTMASNIIIAQLSRYFEHIFDIHIDLILYLDGAISFLITGLIFMGLLKFLPAINLRWRSLIWGATVTTILFQIGRYLISLYFSHSLITSFYGTAGSLVIVVLWIYYTVQILLLGAEVSKYYEGYINETEQKIEVVKSKPLKKTSTNTKKKKN